MSERDDALGLLQRAAAEVLGGDAPHLIESATLEEVEIESLDLVEMVMVVEEAEGYIIDAAELESASSVADLIDVILEKRKSLA